MHGCIHVCTFKACNMQYTFRKGKRIYYKKNFFKEKDNDYLNLKHCMTEESETVHQIGKQLCIKKIFLIFNHCLSSNSTLFQASF